VNKNAVILSLITAPLAQSGSANRADESGVAASIHPGLRKVRSVVLHRFGVEPEYADWLRGLTEGADAEAPEAGRGRKGAARHVAGADEKGAAALARDSASLAWTFTVKKSKKEVRLSLSERNTPPLYGAGLLDSVPVRVLEETAKRQDLLVRGRVSKVSGDRFGRFGWKAQTASLREFVLAACAGELGLEVPGQHQSPSPLSFDAKPKGSDLSQADCDMLIAYVRTLPAPVALRPLDSQASQMIDEGRALFVMAGCAGCHTPDLGDLKGVYSDLLLHHMGQSLNDGGEYYGDSTSPGAAQPDEWRTPPLWGFRDSGPYLHDGRAATLDEAVAHHQGQAEASAQEFFALSASSRLRIQSFLKTLVAPPADPMTAVLYARDYEARVARQRRAEAEQKLLDEAVVERSQSAAEALAEARRVAEEGRAEVSRETKRLREEEERNEKTSLWRAESKLRAARDLERAGKTSAALDFYRDIVAKFRDTEQGRAAAARVAALSR
jgi:mono/diheme cytochrome c family protein